ncbi:MAG: DUF4282 domain-containing protein [Gemmataceae bacterium]|nr:DUF4282 domain-containing protein [Gemmataceae bacterium]
MPITITCPDCDARIRAPDSMQGRPVKCPKCGAQFTADGNGDSGVGPDPIPEPPPPPPPEPVTREALWSEVAKAPDNHPAPSPLPVPLPVPAMEQRSPNVVVDFLLFRKLIAPVLVQVLFWIGVLGCIVVGGLMFATVLALLNRGATFGIVVWPLLSTLAVWFLGPLVIRVFCEVLILFFRMNDTLTAIKNATEKQWRDD